MWCQVRPPVFFASFSLTQLSFSRPAPHCLNSKCICAHLCAYGRARSGPLLFSGSWNVSGYSRNPCSLNRERDTALNTCLSPYRITPIHWLMVRRRLWCNDVVRSYWRTRHPLLRFLCRKKPCRQREELGSKRSVSFPIQRTRVTRVTRDVLFHR